jgi:hypothetical protein
MHEAEDLSLMLNAAERGVTGGSSSGSAIGRRTSSRSSDRYSRASKRPEDGSYGSPDQIREAVDSITEAMMAVSDSLDRLATAPGTAFRRCVTRNPGYFPQLSGGNRDPAQETMSPAHAERLCFLRTHGRMSTQKPTRRAALQAGLTLTHQRRLVTRRTRGLTETTSSTLNPPSLLWTGSTGHSLARAKREADELGGVCSISVTQPRMGRSCR